MTEEIVQLQANLYRLTKERDELQTTSENQVSQLTQLTGDMDALTTKCDSLNGRFHEEYNRMTPQTKMLPINNANNSLTIVAIYFIFGLDWLEMIG